MVLNPALPYENLNVDVAHRTLASSELQSQHLVPRAISEEQFIYLHPPFIVDTPILQGPTNT
jgi:hypothetical protein